MLPLFLLLAACNGEVDISDDSSAGSTDTAESYEYSGPEPVIFPSGSDATCTGGKSWDFTLRVGDQQGADTVTEGMYVIFRNGDGAVMGDGDYACKDGACVGTAEGGSCSQADQFKLHFEVMDTDGNKSRALEIQGHD